MVLGFYKKMKAQQFFKKIIFVLAVIITLNFGTICFADDSSSTTFWEKMWGEPVPATLYLGMVTVHFNPDSLSDDNWNNQLVGVVYDGYFAGTLLNSFHDRAYVAGIQRYFYRQKISENVTQNVGYRLGLISGYDERMLSFAANTPLLPFPQLIYELSWKHVGIEFGLLPMAATAGLFYQF